MTEMDTEIEKAWEQFKKPWSFREDGEGSAKKFFEAGWKANPAKWTDEDMINAFQSSREFEGIDGTVDIDVVLHMGPVDDLNPKFSNAQEWLEEYKQSKEK